MPACAIDRERGPRACSVTVGITPPQSMRMQPWLPAAELPPFLRFCANSVICLRGRKEMTAKEEKKQSRNYYSRLNLINIFFFLSRLKETKIGNSDKILKAMKLNESDTYISSFSLHDFINLKIILEKKSER